MSQDANSLDKAWRRYSESPNPPTRMICCQYCSVSTAAIFKPKVITYFDHLSTGLNTGRFQLLFKQVYDLFDDWVKEQLNIFSKSTSI